MSHEVKKAPTTGVELKKSFEVYELTCIECKHRGMNFVGVDTPPIDIVQCPNCGHEGAVHYGAPKWTEV